MKNFIYILFMFIVVFVVDGNSSIIIHITELSLITMIIKIINMIDIIITIVIIK